MESRQSRLRELGRLTWKASVKRRLVPKQHATCTCLVLQRCTRGQVHMESGTWKPLLPDPDFPASVHLSRKRKRLAVHGITVAIHADCGWIGAVAARSGPTDPSLRSLYCKLATVNFIRDLQFNGRLKFAMSNACPTCCAQDSKDGSHSSETIYHRQAYL
ncbi:hypothetical protein B0T19DRAFT_104602 [Cercophora scortea]|uniref:Uncharacterized protein n=1 Tax=Cercophora scortea TaxID=314031 RepID=A0AAE0IWS3_9PEZI|nr:hypothetical protein B0T19DRAFT_104602 [Cercophora scortea]